MSCLNFLCIGYFRDKGFGMGSKVGFFGGLILGKVGKIAPTGKTFPEDDENAIHWKRWFRLLIIDQWAIYFPGILIGFLFTGILVTYLAKSSGVILPGQSSTFLFISQQLGHQYGFILAGWASLTGTVILFSALMICLDLISRNLSSTLLTSNNRLGKWLQKDPRKLFYAVMAAMVLLVGYLAHIEIPNRIFMITAYLTGITFMIFPLTTLVLNRQLPKPARASRWSYMIPLAYLGIICLIFVYFVRSFIG
jgi:hypothetical protein